MNPQSHPIDNLSEHAKEQALPAILTLLCYSLGGGKFVDANAVLKVPEERSARDAQRDIALGYAVPWTRQEESGETDEGTKSEDETEPESPGPPAGPQHRDPQADNRDPAVSGPKDPPPATGRKSRG